MEGYIDDPFTEENGDATQLKQAEYLAKNKRREKSRQYQRTNPSPRISEIERATSDLFCINLLRGIT